ncbi:GAF and ANTAR domain-containing protein [Actinoplanes friuliensis]|uniref:ANTAR domain-containing protein n=1 Tax=Actinoplanes friuliensis DSM 7358 TaxID=1246995 RepID=U5VZV4_9ACTN|nr:GAF and ANTAR domain-containing protein [Actinoplanes friuliensis]AGZ41181.1 ANTAR domain-containing protein [Actinoplanes friuliensis DSM 7358]
MTHPQAIKPTDAFAELGRIDFSETDLATALAKVADLARRTVPGADEVSITLVGPGGAHTAAFTGKRALAIDEWQYEQGNGPCLAAAAANLTVTVPDLAGDSRWPAWADHALTTGVHSSMSIGLPLRRSVSGALNVYALEPHAFDDDAVILAETFAGYAAVAMANAHLDDESAFIADHTRSAMDDSALVEQAKGIIMAEHHCTAEEASVILARLADIAGSDLHDAATALIDEAVRH